MLTPHKETWHAKNSISKWSTVEFGVDAGDNGGAGDGSQMSNLSLFLGWATEVSSGLRHISL